MQIAIELPSDFLLLQGKQKVKEEIRLSYEPLAKL